MDSMTFDELWEQVKQLKVLPDAAIIQIPYILKDSTKKKLCKQSPQDVAEIITSAIDEINRGSVETVDALVRKRLY